MINLNKFITERLKINSDTKLSSNEESNKEFYLIFFHKKQEKDIPLSKFEDGKNCIKFVNNDMYRILYVVSPLILDKVIKALNQKYDNSYLYKSSNMTLKDIDSSWKKVKGLDDYVDYFKKFTEIKV